MSRVGKKDLKREPTLHDVLGVLGTMNIRFDSIDTRLTSIEHGQGDVKMVMGEMQSELASALTAIDKDSVQLIDHERRIRRLEKSSA